MSEISKTEPDVNNKNVSATGTYSRDSSDNNHNRFEAYGDYRSSYEDRGDSRGGRSGGYSRHPKYNKYTSEKLDIDYKKPSILKKFLTERGKILPRSITGISAKVQRKISKEVKRARFIGFLPYV